MKLFLILLLYPALAAADGPRAYRWMPKEWKPLPYLFSASLESFLQGKKPIAPISVGFGELARSQDLLGAKGEIVGRGRQTFRGAVVEGTWTQTIFHPDGHVLYAAGAVYDGASDAALSARIDDMGKKKSEFLARAMKQEQIRGAAVPMEAELRMRKEKNGGYTVFWNFEWIPASEDRILTLRLLESGAEELEEMPMVGADGRAVLYPSGPRLSSLSETVLSDLLGDGTISGRRLRVASALDLEVWSPNLLFMYPEEDRRFDLAQVYYLLDRSFVWMKQRLNAELQRPVNVKVHIGKNGVSNNSFYGQNTIYLGTGDGLTYRDMLKDPSILSHEAVHAIIDTYVGLPSQGEGGSLNEGFADLFAALMLDNPRFAEVSYLKGPYRRTLEHDLKAYQDFTSNIYRNGSIIAATFWDLKPILGSDRLAEFAFRTLTRLGSGAGFADLPSALMGASTGFLTAPEQTAVFEKVRARGWVVVL
jgi:hypothetical protein